MQKPKELTLNGIEILVNKCNSNSVLSVVLQIIDIKIIPILIKD